MNIYSKHLFIVSIRYYIYIQRTGCKAPVLLAIITSIFKIMKKIKTKDIDPKKLITKSEYARQHKTNPTTVQNMIERGDLTIIVAQGAELIHL